MDKDLVIGVDSSTTACKVIVWDRLGNAIAEGRSPLPIYSPHPSWYEQSPYDWWRATILAIKQACTGIDPSRLGAICVTHQRETFVPVDHDNKPLRNGILWMDERCRSILPTLEKSLGKENFHRTTGKPLSVNLTICKIEWLRQYEPELFKHTARFLDVHAYIIHRLTGNSYTGWGCADPTGMFDMVHHDWAYSLADSVGVRPDQLPKAFPPGEIIGQVSPSVGEECEILVGLPVVSGIGDGQMNGLGVNITQPGDAYLALGTSVVSGIYSDNFITHPTFRTLYGGIPKTYLLETALMGGGFTLSWFQENFAHPEIDYERVAYDIPPGSQGLILVPYWNSVLSPYWDAAASGIIVGWRGIHTPAHLYRSILEGVAFEQRLATTCVEIATDIKVKRYIVTGGGAQSELWCQIIADVSGKPVDRATTKETAALGAGILAAYAIGWYPNIRHAAKAMTHILPETFKPKPERYELYSRVYEEVYSHLFPVLQPYLDHMHLIFSKVE